MNLKDYWNIQLKVIWCGKETKMNSVEFSIRDVDLIEWLPDKKTGISTLGIEQ